VLVHELPLALDVLAVNRAPHILPNIGLGFMALGLECGEYLIGVARRFFLAHMFDDGLPLGSGMDILRDHDKRVTLKHIDNLAGLERHLVGDVANAGSLKRAVGAGMHGHHPVVIKREIGAGVRVVAVGCAGLQDGLIEISFASLKCLARAFAQNARKIGAFHRTLEQALACRDANV